MNISFDFQAWMSEEIAETVKRFSDKISSSCSDVPRIATKLGQIPNLTNQLRQVLYDVDIKAEIFHKKINFCSCLYHGEIWQKKGGCGEDTRCGQTVKPNQRDFGKMANFHFSWNETTEKVVANKIAQKET